jgi:hypothetical protein
MSQTYNFARAIRVKHRGHIHKLHLVVIEDCDADDASEECSEILDKGDGDRIFEILRKAIGFQNEVEQ